MSSIDSNANQMLDDHNNPEFNAFEEGPVANECKDNCRILLRNVSSKLKRHAIDALLSQFGKVVDINLPKNQDSFNNKEGFVSWFAEFSKFSEAEKAIRELNDPKNEGLQFRAAFARPKRDSEPVKFVYQSAPKKIEMPEEEILRRLPITVNYEIETDDVYELVTAFERKAVYPVKSYEAYKQREMLIKLSRQSEGSYDEDNQSFFFNRELFDREPPKQKCNRTSCENEALLRCETTLLYYCSIQCNLMSQEPVVDDPIAEKEIKQDEPIQMNDKVVIMGIINEKCLYVRRAVSDDIRLMNEVFKHSKRAPKLENFPEIGDLLLARYIEQVYRAKVIHISDDDDYAITVQLIDYGNTAQVFLGDLMEMSEACQRIKCITHKVLLKDVNIDAINEDVVSFLEELQDDKAELTVKQIEGSQVVLMLNKSVNINEKVVSLSVIKEASYADGAGAFLEFNSEKSIQLGCNQKMFVVSMEYFEKTGNVVCFPEADLKDFLALYKAINIYGNKYWNPETSAGIPAHNDEIFLAFCNDQWHRAVISKTAGDGKPECCLIDQLSKQKISLENILPMPKIFKDPRPFVQICQVDGCGSDWSQIEKFAAGIIEEGKSIFVDEVMQGTEDSTVLKIKSVLRFKLKEEQQIQTTPIL